MSWEAVLTGAVAALTAAVSWLGVRVNKPKITAETERLRVETALTLVAPLEARVKVLESEMHELHAGIEVLIIQLQDNGVTPLWTPYRRK